MKSYFNVANKKINSFSFKLIAYLLLAICFCSAWRYMEIDYSPTLTTFIVFFAFFILIVRYKNVKYISNIPLLIYLIWSLTLIFFGIFSADDYWEYKNWFGNSLALLTPLIAYFFFEPTYFYIIYRSWVKLFLILMPIILILCPHNEISVYLQPLLLLILFFPLLKFREKLLLVVITSLLMIDLDVRSNIIRIVGFFFIGSLSYYKYINGRFILLISRVLTFLPIILFLLAIFNVFNIFQADRYLSLDYKFEKKSDGEVKEESILNDTRTFLYEEALLSSYKNGHIIFGRTPAKGYESEVFGDDVGETIGKLTADRSNSEVGIIGIYIWLGVVGVILYFNIFYGAINLSIKKSNNIYIKLVGLAMSFMWFMTWIENTVVPHILNVVIFTLIGLCYSEKFRGMSNAEFASFMRNTFEFPLRNIY